MKNIFRKNQVIIIALAIMIAVAGYLNFTNDKVAKNDNNKKDSYANANGVSYDDTNVDTDSLVNSADLASDDLLANVGEENDSKEAAATEGDKKEADTSDLTDSEDAKAMTDISDEDIAAVDGSVEVSDNGEVVKSDKTKDKTDSKDTTGEAVLVNNTIGSSFFSSARLKREQTRAKAKENLMKIIDNEAATENQKKEALDNIIDINTTTELEGITETLIEAKGFKNVVVLMSEGSVEVIVEATNITDQQVAQIENIVKDKAKVEAENIKITPVKMN